MKHYLQHWCMLACCAGECPFLVCHGMVHGVRQHIVYMKHHLRLLCIIQYPRACEIYKCMAMKGYSPIYK